MKSTLLSLFSLCFLFLNASQAQNFLRVQDPNGWGALNSNVPGWEDERPHGQFDEVTIIAEPQGIYTEIGFYASISQGPDAWTWTGNYEIIMQFELPNKAIVHDSWLWVGNDIIKADVVDYWTALQTYEDIVDRNQDPSFLYQLPDNRYEIRIFPLPEGDFRRIKLSFLVPAEWDAQAVSSSLLNNILQSTEYLPDVVKIGMPLDDRWGVPVLDIDGVLTPFTDTVTGGSGDLLHYMTVDAATFIDADKTTLNVTAPYTADGTFLSTYIDGNDRFYQLVCYPDWENIVASSDPKKALILLDYDAAKTSLSKAELAAYLKSVLLDHFKPADAINIAVNAANAVAFLDYDWWEFDEIALDDALNNLLQIQQTGDLALLLAEGFAWSQNHPDIDEIYLLAANDTYVYPPVADDVFSDIVSGIPGNVPFTLLDYQDKNVSILFYNNEEYHGNEYFYALLAGGFSSSETVVHRDMNQTFVKTMEQLFPAVAFPGGILDYYTSLQNGVCFQRYNINEETVTIANKGVIMQTGKYLGALPMNLDATFISNAGDVWTVSKTITEDEVLPGDTLMREMWYGPHLKLLEAQSNEEEDIQAVIQQSIDERVLTGFTAFLALEPNQGGEPCIDCLYNNGGGVVSTDEIFDIDKAELVISPNPASSLATIRLACPGVKLLPGEWSATIFDASGKRIAGLDNPVPNNNTLEWQWVIGSSVKAGFYFCKITSDYGELVGKIVVIKN